MNWLKFKNDVLEEKRGMVRPTRTLLDPVVVVDIGD